MILDNPHGSMVIVKKPERGRTARMDRELDEKLQPYKAGLRTRVEKDLPGHTEGAGSVYQESRRC